MKSTLRLEELAMFLAGILVLNYLDVSWWWYLLLLLGPDVSMLGYLAGSKVGAVVYNIFHHKGIAVIITMAGFYFNNDIVCFAGVVLFGHSSMDRFFGYGLKHFEGFKFTHLGQIGKNRL